jgi:hypothetical protein
MSEKNVKAMETTEEITGGGVYKFRTPAKIDGEECTEIAYDFTALDGSNIRHARAELGKIGYVVTVKELDSCFHAAMFAEAAGVSLADVERFDMRDYEAVADIAKDFLYGEE